MTDPTQVRMRDVLKAHQLRIQPSGGVCSCGEWTERPYGSLLWGPDDWEEHLEEALEAAGILHAAEVKVLTETATRVAYALGRKDAGEEIAAAIENNHGWQTEAQQAALDVAAHIARMIAYRDLPSQDPHATSDATSGVPESSEVGSGPQGLSNRLPREPCGHPTCPCGAYALHELS